MHSSSYEFDDGIKYVVHHDGDCTGEAIFTIMENDERIIEEHLDIITVQSAIQMANAIGTDNIKVNDSTFMVEGIEYILQGLLIQRITHLIENQPYSFGTLVELEEYLEDLYY